MGAVAVTTLQRVKDALPDQIGSGLRWEEAYVNEHIFAAQKAFCDRCQPLVMVTDDIDLVADTASYAVDSSLISILSVEFSSDGTNWDYYLKPATFRDLDRISRSWRDDTGTRPEWYAVLGAPGLPETATDEDDDCRIFIHRPMSAVSNSEKIRIIGYGTESGLSFLGTTVSEGIIDMVHVPFVLAMLLSSKDPQEAIRHYSDFKTGCRQAKARFSSPYAGAGGS